MGRNPVLFLPTHRSYADFCLMTYLCCHYDIDFPAVAAGMGKPIFTIAILPDFTASMYSLMVCTELFFIKNNKQATLVNSLLTVYI